MAIIKAVSSGASLGHIMAYVDKKNALTRGKDCSDDRKDALREMRLTKEIWEKRGGRQYKHYIQSFSPEESKQLSAQTVNEIGLKWAQQNFPGHEVFVSTHTDRGHTHNHFVVNSVNFETGRKLHLEKAALERFKTLSDEICKHYGLSVLERGQKLLRGDVRTYDTKKYQCLAQNKSYLAKAALDMNKALALSTNPKEFKQAMKKLGYGVDWKDNRKHVTLTAPNGKKIRTSNLAKTFSEPKFTKEGIEDEFIRTQEHLQQRSPERGQRTTEKDRGPDQQQQSPARNGYARKPGIPTAGKPAAEKVPSDIQRKFQDLKRRTVDQALGPAEVPAANSRASKITQQQQRSLGRGL